MSEAKTKPTRAQIRAQEAEAERVKQAEAHAAHLATTPMQLLEFLAFLDNLDADTSSVVTLVEEGVVQVHFEWHDPINTPSFDQCILRSDDEAWKFVQLRSQFEDIDRRVAAQHEQVRLAREAWDSIPEPARNLLREQGTLKNRP